MTRRHSLSSGVLGIFLFLSVCNEITQAVKLCGISEDVLQKLRGSNFRREKDLAAIFMKVNPKTLVVELEEEFTDTSFEDIVDELPHQQPRYVAMIYPFKHADGRVSYPLLFIYVSPQDSKHELEQIYAGTKMELINRGRFTRIYNFRGAEKFTEEAIQQKLR